MVLDIGEQFLILCVLLLIFHQAVILPPQKPMDTDSDSDSGSGSSQEQPQRVQDLWFDNGTLVLQAESSMFCVYKSILSIRSSVLRGILSKPQTNFIEGCPVVPLDDSADDLTYFLKATFRPEYENTTFSLTPRTHFPCSQIF